MPLINNPETVNAWVMAGGKVWEVSGATQPQFMSIHADLAARKTMFQGLVPKMMPFYEKAK